MAVPSGQPIPLRRRVAIIGGYSLICGGVLAMLIFEFALPHGRSLLGLRFPAAPGVVTEVQRICPDYPCPLDLTLHYILPTGTPITFHDRESILDYHVGEAIQVRYNPQNPYDAVIDRNPEYCLVILLLTSGIMGLFAVGTIWVIQAQLKKAGSGVRFYPPLHNG